MTYNQRLHPWCIIRRLPKLQRLIVVRCRRRNDAEAHLRVLRQLTPEADYSIVFDPTLDSTEATSHIPSTPLKAKL